MVTLIPYKVNDTFCLGYFDKLFLATALHDKLTESADKSASGKLA